MRKKAQQYNVGAWPVAFAVSGYSMLPCVVGRVKGGVVTNWLFQLNSANLMALWWPVLGSLRYVDILAFIGVDG